MILFINNGRLGNQLFQFALLRELALPRERVLIIGMDQLYEGFDFDTTRIMHIREQSVNRYAHYALLNLLLRPLAWLRILSMVGLKRTPDGGPTVELVRRPGLLRKVRWVRADFYQSEVFFSPDIKSAIRVKDAYRKDAEMFLAGLPDGAKKVFVHVRRGDYERETYLDAVGLCLPAAYYRKAVEVVRSQVADAFFVFLTDDPAYCRTEFVDIDRSVISNNPMFVDFAIMTRCEAGIISNSTFSWWGAYLMRDPVVIISPRFWYGWRQRVGSHPHIHARSFRVLDFDA